MKKLILILFTISLQSQVSLEVFQDVSLAVTSDDYGNTPYTADVRLEFMMHSPTMVMGGTYEYADLAGGRFTRYGVQGGLNLPERHLLVDFDWQILFGAGVIHRETNHGNLSLELTSQIFFPLSDRLSIGLKGTLMQRQDLLVWDDPAGSFRPWDWKPNGYIGIKYYIKE